MSRGAQPGDGAVRWRLWPGTDAESGCATIRRALSALVEGDARDLKRGRRKRLHPLALQRAGAPDHLLKVHPYPPGRGLWRLPGHSRARRELRIAAALARRGVAVAPLLAAGERRRAGRLVECLLLVPLLEGALDLRRLHAEGELSVREEHALAEALGRLVRRAHDAGLVQHDLAPNNVLVRRGTPPQLWLVDFERASLRPARRAPGAHARRTMLAKLDRELPDLRRTLRLRFLLGYALGDGVAARDEWRAVAGARPRLAARDERRLRRTAARDGRRFHRIAIGAWEGFAWREAEGPLLRAALADWDRPATGSRGAPDPLPLCLRPVTAPNARPRDLRALWARANALFKRGLSPRPLALLWRGQEAVLLLEPGAMPIAQTDARSALAVPDRRAVSRLLSALLEYGDPTEAMRAEQIGLLPPTATRTSRALLLDPACFGFRRGGGSDSGRRIAARLEALLAPAP